MVFLLDIPTYPSHEPTNLRKSITRLGKPFVVEPRY